MAGTLQCISTAVGGLEQERRGNPTEEGVQAPGTTAYCSLTKHQ